MTLFFIAKGWINLYFVSANRFPFEFMQGMQDQPALALQVAQCNPSGSGRKYNVTKKRSCEVAQHVQPAHSLSVTAPCSLGLCVPGDCVGSHAPGIAIPNAKEKVPCPGFS